MITFELKNKKPLIKAVIGKEIEEQEISLEQAEIIAKRLLEFVCEKNKKSMIVLAGQKWIDNKSVVESEED